MFAVFVDTCVLLPIVKAEIILRCAEKGLYSIKWSDRVLDELHCVLLEVVPSMTEEKANKRIQAMNEAFPYAKVTGWEGVLPKFIDLPDENDAHVAAAALYAKADVIVTDNISDFPNEHLGNQNLFAQTMDEFMCDLWDLKPQCPHIIFSVLEDIARQYKEDWRSLLSKIANEYRMSKFAALVYNWHWNQHSMD